MGFSENDGAPNDDDDDDDDGAHARSLVRSLRDSDDSFLLRFRAATLTVPMSTLKLRIAELS